MGKMIKNTALAAKRKGGGMPVPGMNAPAPGGLPPAGGPPGLPPTGGAPGSLPPGMKKGGTVKLAGGGSARGWNAAKKGANNFKGAFGK